MEDRNLQIMKRAQSYIEYLANGINPLTGEVVDDNDVINEVRISRCLFYVSKMLKEDIEREEKMYKKSNQIPFDLKVLNLADFHFTEEPLTITAFIDKINELKPDNMKGLTRQPIYNWLINEGVLKLHTYEGKTYKIPTELGEVQGISYEQKEGSTGRKYLRTTYDKIAQKYIYDHLESILKIEEN